MINIDIEAYYTDNDIDRASEESSDSSDDISISKDDLVSTIEFKFELGKVATVLYLTIYYSFVAIIVTVLALANIIGKTSYDSILDIMILDLLVIGAIMFRSFHKNRKFEDRAKKTLKMLENEIEK